MKKGVSAIIATILLLMITIGLAGMAYVFMSGMMTSRTSKVISLLDTSCTDTNITIVISNDGTNPINPSSDIKVFVDNIQDTSVDFSNATVEPHKSLVITGIDDGVVSGANTILVVSPTNAVHSTVFC